MRIDQLNSFILFITYFDILIHIYLKFSRNFYNKSRIRSISINLSLFSNIVCCMQKATFVIKVQFDFRSFWRTIIVNRYAKMRSTPSRFFVIGESTLFLRIVWVVNGEMTWQKSSLSMGKATHLSFSSYSMY